METTKRRPFECRAASLARLARKLLHDAADRERAGIKGGAAERRFKAAHLDRLVTVYCEAHRGAACRFFDC
jgi:hypothetical protein